MARSEAGGRVLSMVLAAAIGALITGAGAWVTWAASVDADIESRTTEAEVIELIETRSPYLYDKGLIHHELRRLADEFQRIREMAEHYFEGTIHGPPEPQ